VPAERAQPAASLKSSSRKKRDKIEIISGTSAAPNQKPVQENQQTPAGNKGETQFWIK
jgi:hypothetical protein